MQGADALAIRGQDHRLAAAAGLLIDLARAPADWQRSWQPLGFVDLDTCRPGTALASRPPFPLIGLGDAAHPLAAVLDCIVEPPVTVAGLIRQICRSPHAATVGVQVLRALENVSAAQGLSVESFGYGLLQGSAEHARWLAVRPHRAPPGPAGGLLIERHESVLRLTIDRPLARNAIDRVLRDQLHDAFSVAAFDSEIRVIELRAVGPVFSIGGELAEFGITRDPALAHVIRSQTLPAAVLGGHAAALEVHVQGACIGAGLELAAFGSRVTATADAWFQLPEIAMGLIPGAGGCVSVPRRIGRQRAALMILSGRRINAVTALRWGLIDAIAPNSP